MLTVLFQAQQEVEAEAARKKQTITEELKNIDALKLRFLRAAKIQQDIQTRYSAASVDVQQNKIVIRGLPGEVTNIKVRIIVIRGLPGEITNIKVRIIMIRGLPGEVTNIKARIDIQFNAISVTVTLLISSEDRNLLLTSPAT